jgi:hypothetical protein
MQLRGDRNQCQGCKEFFNSTYAFDKHRHGTHGLDRRCLTSIEMKAKGMSTKEDGFWITSEMPFPRVAFVQNRRDHEAMVSTLHTHDENVSNLNTQNLYNSQK